jgi:transposase-like protein
MGDIWHLDELFVTIQGQRQYLCNKIELCPKTVSNDMIPV